jgi:hypothetical protein
MSDERLWSAQRWFVGEALTVHSASLVASVDAVLQYLGLENRDGVAFDAE